MLRFAAGPGEVRPLAELVTQAGALLLARSWSCLLVDVRQRPCFSREALEWLQRQWFARIVPQPPNLFKVLLLPEQTRARAIITPLLEKVPT